MVKNNFKDASGREIHVGCVEHERNMTLLIKWIVGINQIMTSLI